MRKLVILHNSYDPVSREFVEVHGETVDDIIDWYNFGEVDRWLEMGGNMRVSAFPSMAIIENGEAEIYRMPTEEEIKEILGEEEESDPILE